MKWYMVAVAIVEGVMPHSRTSWSPPIRCPGSTGHSEATGLARTKRYAHEFAASGLLNREPWLARQFVVLVEDRRSMSVVGNFAADSQRTSTSLVES